MSATRRTGRTPRLQLLVLALTSCGTEGAGAGDAGAGTGGSGTGGSGTGATGGSGTGATGTGGHITANQSSGCSVTSEGPAPVAPVSLAGILLGAALAFSRRRRAS
jgi:MYXO-CTERM domain-containing protein